MWPWLRPLFAKKFGVSCPYCPANMHVKFEVCNFIKCQKLQNGSDFQTTLNIADLDLTYFPKLSFCLVYLLKLIHKVSLDKKLSYRLENKPSASCFRLIITLSTGIWRFWVSCTLRVDFSSKPAWQRMHASHDMHGSNKVLPKRRGLSVVTIAT